MGQEILNKRKTGCLMPLALYVTAVTVMYFITLPAEVTDDFSGRTARLFSIAIVDNSADGAEFRRVSLDTVQSRDALAPPLVFLLPEENVAIAEGGGEVFYATVLEEHEDWQLIAYDYGENFFSRSTYKAYPDRVEPVSFKVKGHVGQAMIAMLLFFPVCFLAILVTYLRNRRARARLPE